MTKQTLMDVVAQECRHRPSRKLIDKVPADLRKELEAIKAAWRAGKLSDRPQSKTGLGKILVRQLRLRGFVLSEFTVFRWLENQDG